MIKTVDAREAANHFPEWLKQVAAGHEVVITHHSKPMAKLVRAEGVEPSRLGPLDVPPLLGARILTPEITSAEIAEEMWSRT